MIRYFILSIFSLSCLISFSQEFGSMRGLVTRTSDYTPIEGVTIYIKQDSVLIDSTVTNTSGRFSIDNIKTGSYKVIALKKKYSDLNINQIVIQNHQTTHFNFKLTKGNSSLSSGHTPQNGIPDGSGTGTAVQDPFPNLSQLNSSNLSCVEIVTYKTALIDKNGGASGSTITREDIARLPGRNAESIATTIGGVQSNGNGEIISIRGARKDANAYYLDGMRVRNLNGLPKSSINSVTTYTGGIPANYGDATGGIISVTTKSSPNTLYTSPRFRSNASYYEPPHYEDFNTESYEVFYENEFLTPENEPLSTFSIDVDNASYSNVRRILNSGRLPGPGAVRTEELINYFQYNYEVPDSRENPIAIHTELGTCPWNKNNQLLKIGLKGYEIPKDNLAPSNLVFLIDVSGSMSYWNKLPLLKQAMKLLTKNLREEDRVSIVVYAGSSGMVLPPTSGKHKGKINIAINQLESGGSTNGAAGINLAYQLAEEHFIKDGNNRVILATDGDFNVGTTSNDELEQLIEEKRKTGVFLTTLGFGMGNYQDDRMEMLADKGNGNYFYIDNIREAKKVLVTELFGTIYTIAKDVKLQLEFNPTQVKGYRLVGYENRLLAAQDFNNDLKDAGELGSGHTVTALYELIPTSSKHEIPNSDVDTLRYQTPALTNTAATDELVQIKCRYKLPESDTSTLVVRQVKNENSTLSNDYYFAASVAAYGMLLRKSDFIGDYTFSEVYTLAKRSKGDDPNEYRSEFLSLVKTARTNSKIDKVN